LIFDEDESHQTALELFPDNRSMPLDAARAGVVINAMQLRIAEVQLFRSRAFGDCFLACQLWNQL